MTQCSVELNIQKEEVSSTSKTVLKFGESLSTVVGRQMKSEAVTSRVKSIYRLLQSRCVQCALSVYNTRYNVHTIKISESTIVLYKTSRMCFIRHAITCMLF